MKTIVINGEYMETRELAHQYIKNQLEFPDYYGENLDALWDLLSTESEEMTIIVENCEIIVDHLGQYGVDLLETFSQVGEENPHLEIEMF